MLDQATSVLMGAFGLGAAVKAPPLELTAWLVHWDGGDSMDDFEAHADLISRVCPGWYICDVDGLPRRLSEAAVPPKERAKVLEIAKHHGVKVFALTSNFSASKGDFDPDIVSRFLEDPELMRQHVQGLLGMVKEDGADGLDLDYEGLHAKDRDAFSTFTELLAAALHQAGLKLAIAVHPKIAEPGTWGGDKAQDWVRLGRAVDYFRPMTYDFHWSTSAAGPIAPPEWTEKVLALACQLVPRDKIELGIPGYGYDWLGKTSNSFNWKGFQDLQKSRGLKAKRDRASGELTFSYKGREVWFVDSKAIEPKFSQAKQAGVRGLALWRAGSGDPEFWDKFKKLR